jgi:flagellar motor switch protein FliN/FliY
MDSASDVANVAFGEVQAAEDTDQPDDRERRRNLEMLYDIPLTVTVRLGNAMMSLRDLLNLGPGAVVELDRLAGESVDLLVNGVLVGRGDVVVVNDNFGLRVTDIVSSEERVRGL